MLKDFTMPLERFNALRQAIENVDARGAGNRHQRRAAKSSGRASVSTENKLREIMKSSFPRMPGEDLPALSASLRKRISALPGVGDVTVTVTANSTHAHVNMADGAYLYADEDFVVRHPNGRPKYSTKV
jgi:hypothetical protein